jgi:ATP-dependent protease ClpP protease subunit
MAHWRGEHSLARSFWINGFILNVLLSFAMDPIGESLANLHVETALLVTVAYMVLFVLVAVWQYVGIWRSASSTVQKTKNWSWSAIAKFFVLLGVIGILWNVYTNGKDIVLTYSALDDSNLSDYEVHRLGETDLVLYGAINDNSVDEVIDQLRDRSIELFQIQSQGGLVLSGIRLARYVREIGVQVMAFGECSSMCVSVLAASPYPSIRVDTLVTFHAAEAIVEFSARENIAESKLQLRKAEEFNRELGIPEWVIEKTKKEKIWTASINQLINMGLLKYIHDPNRGWMEAEQYCYEQPAECSR